MNIDRYAINSETQIAYSIKQLTKLTSMSKNALFIEIKERRLVSFTCGRRRLVSHQAVLDWIKLLSTTK
jgi:hypothetical protein